MAPAPVGRGEGSSALSMSWLSRLLPREEVRVERAFIAKAGWVWKRSRYLRLWRRRWLILTIDSQLLTFEDEMQSTGATDHFVLRSAPPAVHPKGHLQIEVGSASRRRTLIQRQPVLRASDEEAFQRTVTISLDSGVKGNDEWVRAMTDVLSARPGRGNAGRFNDDWEDVEF